MMNTDIMPRFYIVKIASSGDKGKEFATIKVFAVAVVFTVGVGVGVGIGVGVDIGVGVGATVDVCSVDSVIAAT